jgi:deoxycytidylate deaminase
MTEIKTEYVPSSREEQFISLAAHEAEKSPVLMRHGALAVCNGRILAKGYNHYRSHSCDHIMNGGCTCHAECDVLHKLLKTKPRQQRQRARQRRTTMYITRIGISGELRESAPCHDCYEKMLFYGIRTLIFTTEVDNQIQYRKCNIEDFNPSVITTGQRWVTRSTTNEN